MDGAIILMYHVIDEPRTPAERQWCCTPRNFERQMQWLAERYKVVTLDQLMDLLASPGSDLRRTVCITFDDGTRCLLERALPILVARGLPATAFVLPGLLGRQNDWLVASGWSPRPLLGAQDLDVLRRAGIDIGCHSKTHADLALADVDRLQVEVTESKALLERVLGSPVKHFAYPFGRVAANALVAVREAGYRSACGVEPGWNTAATNAFLLRRVEVFNWDSLLEFDLKLRFALDHVRPNIQFARVVTKRLLESVALRSRDRLSD